MAITIENKLIAPFRVFFQYFSLDLKKQIIVENDSVKWILGWTQQKQTSLSPPISTGPVWNEVMACKAAEKREAFLFPQLSDVTEPQVWLLSHLLPGKEWKY